MLHVERCLDFTFLPAASNDNEDLLSFLIPSFDLAMIRDIKYSLREENSETGMLLFSRKHRKFFQEVVDAERYIVMRYFSTKPIESELRRLKRYILDNYLFPKKRRSKKKPT